MNPSHNKVTIVNFNVLFCGIRRIMKRVSLTGKGSNKEISEMGVKALCAMMVLIAASTSQAATHYVSLSGSHTLPFTSWESAATNIQDALFVCDPNDDVHLTNGVYNVSNLLFNTFAYMTGAITGPVYIDASQSYEAWGNGPWSASDNGPADYQHCWYCYPANLPQWWRIDFGFPRVVSSYKFYHDYLRYPSAWIFQASIDNSLWVDLHSVAGYADNTITWTPIYTFNNTNAYRYYRLLFTNSVWMNENFIYEITFGYTNIALIGAGRTNTIIDAAGSYGIYNPDYAFHYNDKIGDLTIQNNDSGCGFWNMSASNVLVKNCLYGGYGIYYGDAVDSTFESNTLYGFYTIYGMASNCVFRKNGTLASCGGGVAGGVTASKIYKSSITENVSSNYGGAVIYSLIEDCVVQSNTCLTARSSWWNEGGGGVFLDNGAVMRRCVITDNKSLDGSEACAGGVWITANNLIEGSFIDRNSATYGGGIGGRNNMTNIVIRNTAIRHNNASRGGGVVINEWADGQNQGNVCRFDHCLIADNVASVFGAAEICDGSASFTNCTLTGNRSTGDINQYPDFSVRWGITVFNSIIYANRGFFNEGGPYYASAHLAYCISDWISANDPVACTNVDPLFAETNYYRIKSSVGTWDDSLNMWIAYVQHSPGIDAGDPTSDYSNEPQPNGWRINIGWDGNTPHASKGGTNLWLIVLTHNDGGFLTGTNNALCWAGGGFGLTDTVRLGYSTDLGASWTTIVKGIAATNGVYVWDVTGVQPMVCCWRVVCEMDTNVWDRNDQWVSVNGGSAGYFVNDGSTNGDVYCTTVGSNGNSGRSSDSPLTSVNDLLGKYVLGSGDVIYVDTGVYSNRIDVTGNDSGSGVSGWMTIQGSTNTAAGGTVLVADGDNALYLNGAVNIRVRDLRLRNSSRGVSIYRSSGIELEGVLAYNNSGHGYEVDNSYVTMKRCVAAWNSTYGLSLFGHGVTCENCVFWENGNGVYAYEDEATIRNSLIRQTAGGAYAWHHGSIQGDYNVFDLIGPATVAGSGYSKLSDWQKAVNGEWHSTVASVDLANPAGLDFHPKSVEGRYDMLSGTWVTDAVQSACIDFGDPAAAYTNEPAPNGSRVNVGNYGNSGEASKSQTNAALLTLTFNDGGTLATTQRVYWLARNFTNGATVRVECSNDGGTNWILIASRVDAASGSFLLSPGAFGSTFNGRWQVVSESDTNVYDSSDEALMVNRQPTMFYVNDQTTNGDVYCTALGNDANSGLTPDAPMATVSGLLAKYTLGAGDIFYIDTGVYSEPVYVGTNDSGTTNGYLIIQGSTNYAAGGSVFDYPGATIVYLESAHNIRMMDVTVKGGSRGVYVNNSSGIELERVVAVSNTDFGFHVFGSYAKMKGCVAAKNGYGLAVSHHSVEWENGVFWENGIAVNANCSITIRNSLMRQVGGQAYRSDYDWRGEGDFNVFDLSGSATLAGPSLSKLSDYQKTYNREWHSTVSAADLANPEGLDFHPKSVMGRYDMLSGTWVTDAVQSVCIDFGDPAAAWTNEPEPDGSRLNVGNYGNTAEASKSRTNAWLRALTFNDGGGLSGTSNALYWAHGGFEVGAIVRVEYSTNFGVNWVTVQGELPATNGMYVWDVSKLNPMSCYWRVMSEGDPNVWDRNEQRVSVNGQWMGYYINDGNISGDIYCTVGGDDANTGMTPDSPMNTVTGLLAKYVLSGWDTIYVDTGVYSNQQIYITGNDSGSGVSGWMTIQGSTNYAAGGSVFDYPGATIVYLESAHNIRMMDATVKGGSRGVYVDNSSGIELERVVAVSNTDFGFHVFGSYAKMKGCVAAKNGYGLAVSHHSVEWENGVFWENGIAVNANCSITIRNSLMRQVGGQAYRSDYDWRGEGDFNVFDLSGSATLAGPSLSKLSDYQKMYNWEWHSTVSAADLANPEELDFHPKSVEGRWNGTGWVTDTVQSACIDFGDPAAAYTNEPAPNGSRVNVGNYGNSGEASKSQTNAALLTLTFNDGGTLATTQRVYWLARNFTNGATVRVECSNDGGTNWILIASRVDAASGSFLLSPGAFGSTFNGRWQVVSESDTNVYDSSDEALMVNRQPTMFYVNDQTTNGDVYCTAVGNDANSGLVSDSPLLSLQEVIDRYDLNGGDVVYVDTGNYLLTNIVIIGLTDSGTSNEYMTIQGSTNFAAGGSVFDRRNPAEGTFVLTGASFVQMLNLTLKGGASGLALIGNSEKNRFIHLVARDQDSYGVYVHGASHNNEFSQCAVAGNTNYAVRVHSSTNVSWQNCVFWNPGGLFIDSSAETTVSNCILRASSGSIFFPNYGGKLMGDYNVIYLEGAATVFNNDGTIYPRLSDVQQSLNQQWHSCVFDPQLADPTNFDFHPRSQAGRYVTGVGWTNDAVTSGVIDMGYPSAAYSNEPEPNGARLNVGNYGNSIEASMSSTNAILRALTFNDGGTISGTGELYWVAVNFSNTATVRLEYSLDDGAHWSNIATGIRATNEMALWDTTLGGSSARARWRVVSESDSNIHDQVDHVLSVHNTNLFYYVNDGNTAGDVYCTAVGNDANSGLVPDSPLLSLQEVIDRYDLNGGDVVYVDTGNYLLTNIVIIGLTDSGTSNEYMTIQGSTNFAAGGSVFDRRNPAEGTFVLTGASFVQMLNLTLKGGASGLALIGNSEKNRFIHLVARDQDSYGVYVHGASHNNEFSQCAVAGNTNYAVRVHSSTNVSWQNCVFWNPGGLFIDSSAETTVSNCILRASSGSIFFPNYGGKLMGDYNVIYLEGAATVFNNDGTIYPRLSDVQQSLNQQWHSCVFDPQLADPTNFDFHPRSQVGRYVTGVGWTNDAVTSGAIDMGYPSAAWTNEPTPNGSRVNVGNYGNTSEASKSRTNRWLRALTFNDGGIASGVSKLYWIGGNLSPTSEVYVEYQADNGGWQGVATHVPVSTDHCDLNTAGLEQTFNARWRVVLESDPNVVDVNDQPFTVRNTNNLFYVNDTSGAGDIYCTGIGSSANSGRTPETPKDSIQGILDDYDLQSGDKIYVDTGLYPMANLTITITNEDQGAVGSPVVIQGSTNVTAGGTILDRLGTGGQVLYFNHADYIRCRDLVVRGAQDGIYLSHANGVEFERVQSISNIQYGFYLTESYAGMLHCVAAYNACGLYVNYYNAAWEGGVLWGNGMGVQADSSASVTISNSVIGQASGQAYNHYLQNIQGDYNAFDLTGTATLGGSEHSKLSDYQQTYDREWHSAAMSADFADPAGLDFHPLSAAGRYLPGYGWMNDAIDSRSIDMGAPQAPYANEPAPNGERLNIGLYGNTCEASKSRTNARLQVLTFNDGGTFSEAQSIYWIAQHFTNGATVRVEYSTNNGLSWLVIAQAIPAKVGQYGLEPFAYGSGTGVYWRIVSEGDTNVWDQNDQAFRYANGDAFYYVNDNSRMGDVFTTAVGNDANSGRTNSAPKATLRNLLDTYKLKGGDVVYIDTGIYRVTNDIVLAAGDSGYDVIHLRIQGSTNEIWPTSIAGGGLVLQNVKAVDVNNLNIQNANTGLKLSQSSNCVVTWVQCHGNAAHGFVVTNSENCSFRHCVSMNNAQAGLLNASSIGTWWESGVMWSNRLQGVRLEGGELVMHSSAIASMNTNAVSYYLGSGSLTADYNSVYVTNGAAVGYLASNGTTIASLPAWTLATGCDSNSLSDNPGFVDPVAGDFHEKSTNAMGQYLRGYGWTNDVETSVLIDAGDPNELDPNGSRINIGLYGNTSESSK